MFCVYISHNNNYKRSGAHSFEYYKLTIMFYILVFPWDCDQLQPASATGVSTLHPAADRWFAFPINLPSFFFARIFRDFDGRARSLGRGDYSASQLISLLLN